MKKYVINLAKRIGTNVIDSLYLNTYDNREEWQNNICVMMNALIKVLPINTSVKVDYRSRDEFVYATIEY